jgi:hypothetical protein
MFQPSESGIVDKYRLVALRRVSANAEAACHF